MQIYEEDCGITLMSDSFRPSKTIAVAIFLTSLFKGMVAYK